MCQRGNYKCIIFPPESSLERARKIPNELFSQIHRVSRLLLDRPLNDSMVTIKGSDAVANSALEFPLVLPAKVLLRKQWKKGPGRDSLIHQNEACKKWVVYVTLINPEDVPRDTTRSVADYANGTQL
ncbi:hypothetical protein PHET_06750 [Paragonimus heterotremus]|uniref:Uncharacterized protein n=1 Tax=Paragonimus heterotremus TaxID=100268 RepID=A0A8J4SVG2_9TREM|nr:hypothetical protein PHET_06750 [Paragonimus heterotremus]